MLLKKVYTIILVLTLTIGISIKILQNFTFLLKNILANAIIYIISAQGGGERYVLSAKQVEA